VARMRVPVVHPGGRVAWMDAPLPECGPGEVLVRMEAAAICGSDLHAVFASGLREPFPPGGPGHEGVGVVEASRSPRVPPGQRVLTVPDSARGRCFAPYQVVPEAFLVPLPEGASPATWVLAQQLGTVLFALKRFWPEPPGRTAAVLGAGPAGLAFVEALRRLGFAWVSAVDPRPERRAQAARMGAALVLDPAADAVADAILEATDADGVDLAVEASGHDQARILAADLIRKDGRIGFFGLPAGDAPVPFRFDVLFAKRAEIVFSVGAQFEPGLRSFRRAVEWVANEPAFWGELVTHRLPLADLEEGLRMARRPDGRVFKIVLEVDAE